jgi:hypothetical protein
MGPSDYLVSINRRKLACVIEPSLALGSAQGPVLAQRLAFAFEPWLTRSFWQVLDASDLMARSSDSADDGRSALPDATALDAWIALRDTTEAGAWTLRWVGDCVPECQFRDAAPVNLLERYELMLAALIGRIEREQALTLQDRIGVDIRHAGVDFMLTSVDSLALSACLDGALILCVEDGTAEGEEALPAPVRALTLARVDALRIDPSSENNLLVTERAVVRAALAEAGIAPLVQALPRLAAVHAVHDRTFGDADPWQGAHAWWIWI